MTKEIEGTHQIGDMSLYTKSWLVRSSSPSPSEPQLTKPLSL
jgi:acylglycerol lipase